MKLSMRLAFGIGSLLALSPASPALAQPKRPEPRLASAPAEPARSAVKPTITLKKRPQDGVSDPAQPSPTADALMKVFKKSLKHEGVVRSVQSSVPVDTSLDIFEKKLKDGQISLIEIQKLFEGQALAERLRVLDALLIPEDEKNALKFVVMSQEHTIPTGPGTWSGPAVPKNPPPEVLSSAPVAAGVFSVISAGRDEETTAAATSPKDAQMLDFVIPGIKTGDYTAVIRLSSELSPPALPKSGCGATSLNVTVMMNGKIEEHSFRLQPIQWPKRSERITTSFSHTGGEIKIVLVSRMQVRASACPLVQAPGSPDAQPAKHTATANVEIVPQTDSN